MSDETARRRQGIRVEQRTPSPQSNLDADRIELSVPARPEYMAVVRLAVAGIAGRLAFSFDDAEDLKLAVGEACNAAVLASARRVRVRFDIASDRLTIRVAHDDAAVNAPSQERDLGMLLMRCLMDDVRIRRAGRHHVIVMSKRLPT
jgi:serine/threonine-protein kinase RsbW